MEALDYLAVLNDEMKEKLMGLWLNRKLEEGETLFDKDK